MRLWLVIGYFLGCAVFGRPVFGVPGIVIALALMASLYLDYRLERDWSPSASQRSRSD
jgi:hypothetical protein